jgi:hypothetical protein
MMDFRRGLTPVVWALVICTASLAGAEEVPLHVEIDQRVAAASNGIQPPLAGDADYLRRVSLDLIGMPPTADEVQSFLTSAEPDKRARIIDRLMASPRYARHWAEWLDVMLMERRANTHVTQDEWMAYLLQSVRDNKPWNRLAREILAADGTDDDPRAAVRFYLDRGSEPNLITRDVGRIFFGRDLQCAQCHDHPSINDYLMADYHGLLAFFSTGFEAKIKEGEKERAYYAERAGSDLQFESVFIQGTKHLTGPRLFGFPEVDEPLFLPGTEYEVPPADNVRPVPKFSRRAKFVELATGGGSRAFNENMVNRLWAALMGRGLVHAVDLHHSDNPASHPELLQRLGERFAASGYDLKAFVRELALTRVYQRSLDRPEDLVAQSSEAARIAETLAPQLEQLSTQAQAAAQAFDAAATAWAQTEAALLPTAEELNASRTKYADSLKKLQEAQKAFADAQAQAAAKQDVAKTLAEAAAKTQEAVAKLKEDQELAAAAAKFTERLNQFTTEIAGLQKTIEDKQAAVAAPQGETDATRAVVEAAQQKALPLRSAFREQQQAMLAVRQPMVDAATVRNRVAERLDTVRLLADLRSRHEQALASAQSLAVREAEVQGARGAVSEFSTVIAQCQRDGDTLAAAELAATEVLNKLQAEHAQRAQLAGLVADAFKSVNAARQLVPDDVVVKESAEKLKQRADELAAALAAHQQQVELVAASKQAATNRATMARQALEGALAERTRREQAVVAAEAALAAAKAASTQDRAAVDAAIATLTARWSEDFTLAELKPLGPEELCWSIFRVTGVYENHCRAEISELDKTTPLSEEARSDPAQVAARERDIEQRVYDKLKGNVVTFVALYGAGAGQPQADFFATADQALFAANGGSILGWAAPSGGNVTERIVHSSDAAQAAGELYRAVLSREPTEQEIADVGTYLASRPEQRAAAAQELVWGLLTSVEFRFNH